MKKQINQKTDSEHYQKKKHFLQKIITVYGRKPTLEVLRDQQLKVYRLHLSSSNKSNKIVEEIESLAESCNIDIVYHERKELSRISKNGKQDQGVCIDILCPKHQSYQTFLQNIDPEKTIRLIALDRITNPQNLGMIIRSVCASGIDGLLIPQSGCARLDGLVVKASAGTLFKTPLLHCNKLTEALIDCKKKNAQVLGLSSHASQSISNNFPHKFIIYVLGNETEGMSAPIVELCDKLLHIPMYNNVESLNVAVTASLLAFKDILTS